MHNNDCTRIDFREPQSAEELTDLLKLRYEVRRSCHLQSICPENESSIDIDSFDSKAHHVGLFQQIDGRSVAVGCSRVVFNMTGPFSDWITSIAEANNMKHKLAPLVHTFPFQTHMPIDYANQLNAQYERALSVGQTFGESGGNVIAPIARSIRTSLFFIESLVACFKLYKLIDYVAMNTTARHAKVYRQFGFQPVEGIPDPWEDSSSPLHVSASTQLITTGHSTCQSAQRLVSLADEFASTGKITWSGKSVRPIVHNRETTQLESRSQSCSFA
jgi:hypothetical protein